MAGFDFSVSGLLTGVQSVIKPTGAEATQTRSITPSVGTQLVGATKQDTSGFWAKLGNLGSAVLDNELVQAYVKGKITKEQINDGIPVYTTTGNPNDQAGGRLLSDVAEQQKNNQRTFLLIGAGVVGVIVIGIIVARRS